MKILLDTNIVIHREAATVVDEDIGILFRWLDNLHHTKCIHAVTAEELEKHEDPKVRKSLRVKLASYNVLKTKALMSDEVRRLSTELDKDQNDLNDTLIINELYSGRVDALQFSIPLQPQEHRAGTTRKRSERYSHGTPLDGCYCLDLYQNVLRSQSCYPNKRNSGGLLRPIPRFFPKQLRKFFTAEVNRLVVLLNPRGIHAQLHNIV